MNSEAFFNNIDFGSNVAEKDYNLKEYYLQHPDFEKIIDGKKNYIIGRKGSGKTAILKMIEERVQSDSICKTMYLHDFPIKELIGFGDDTKIDKFQYVMIWKFLLTIELTNLIVENEFENESTKLLADIIRDFSKESTIINNIEILKKNNKKISVGAKVLEYGGNLGIDFNSNEIKSSGTLHYSKVISLIISTIKKSKCSLNYYFLFDGFDEGFHICDDLDIDLIIRAFITAIEELKYDFGKDFKNFRPVLALRTDILNSFQSRDSNINKIDEQIVNLKWNKYNLRKLIDARISFSCGKTWNDVVDDIYIHKEKENDVWGFIYSKTMQRPRDVIRFLSIAQEINRENKLNSETVAKAETDYSLWFQKELNNELSNFFPSDVLEKIFEIITRIGLKIIPTCEFKENIERYLKNYLDQYNLDSIYILKTLYDYGIIGTIDENSRYLFKFIQEGHFYESNNVIVHNGLHKSLILNPTRNILKGGILFDNIKLNSLTNYIYFSKKSTEIGLEHSKNNQMIIFINVNISCSNNYYNELLSMYLKAIPLDKNRKRIEEFYFELRPTSRSFTRLKNLIIGNCNNDNTHVKLDLNLKEFDYESIKQKLECVEFFSMEGDLY